MEETLTNLARHVIFLRFAKPLCLLPDRGVELPSASFDGPDIHTYWLKNRDDGQYIFSKLISSWTWTFGEALLREAMGEGMINRFDA